jgi:hypothetical protein
LLTLYLMAYIVMFTSGRSGYIAMFIVLTSMSLIYIKNLKKNILEGLIYYTNFHYYNLGE